MTLIALRTTVALALLLCSCDCFKLETNNKSDKYQKPFNPLASPPMKHKYMDRDWYLQLAINSTMPQECQDEEHCWTRHFSACDCPVECPRLCSHALGLSMPDDRLHCQTYYDQDLWLNFYKLKCVDDRRGCMAYHCKWQREYSMRWCAGTCGAYHDWCSAANKALNAHTDLKLLKK